MRDEMHQLKKKIESMVRWYLTFTFGIITLLSGWMGYVAREQTELRQQYEALRADFGLSLLITASQHKDAVGYQELVNKYFARRGEVIK